VRPAVHHGAAFRAERVRKARRLPARLAEAALEQRAEPFTPTLGIENPRSQLERGLMTHVPLMAARELGNPVAPLVLVIPDDLALHDSRLTCAG